MFCCPNVSFVQRASWSQIEIESRTVIKFYLVWRQPLSKLSDVSGASTVPSLTGRELCQPHWRISFSSFQFPFLFSVCSCDYNCENFVISEQLWTEKIYMLSDINDELVLCIDSPDDLEAALTEKQLSSSNWKMFTCSIVIFSALEKYLHNSMFTNSCVCEFERLNFLLVKNFAQQFLRTWSWVYLPLLERSPRTFDCQQRRQVN